MDTLIPAVSTDPTIIYGAIAAAVCVVIAAVGGAVVQIINAVSAARDRRNSAAERLALLNQGKEAAEHSKRNGEKADTLIENTTQIHTLTNSTNSNLQKALEVMTEKTVGLEKLISELKQDKAAAATSQAMSESKRPPELEAPAEQTVQKTLQSIDANTEATAKNTAKTDASMEEMKDKGKKK